MAEEDKLKIDSRDADGRPYELDRAELVLTVLCAAFTRVAKRAPGIANPEVNSWLDDIRTSKYS